MLFVSRAAALELETVKQSLELKLCLWGDHHRGAERPRRFRARAKDGAEVKIQPRLLDGAEV